MAWNSSFAPDYWLESSFQQAEQVERQKEEAYFALISKSIFYTKNCYCRLTSFSAINTHSLSISLTFFAFSVLCQLLYQRDHQKLSRLLLLFLFFPLMLCISWNGQTRANQQQVFTWVVNIKTMNRLVRQTTLLTQCITNVRSHLLVQFQFAINQRLADSLCTHTFFSHYLAQYRHPSGGHGQRPYKVNLLPHFPRSFETK